MHKPQTIFLLTTIAIFVAAACQPNKHTLTTAEATTAQNHLAQTTATPIDREPTRIAAVGDIMLGSTFPNETRMPPNDGADLLKEVTPILSAADIAFGNLEGPMLDGGTSGKCGKRPNCYAFRVPSRYGKHLKAAGFDVLSLANNHAGDFGDEGRRSTRQILDELGIKHAGSDRDKFASTTLEVRGKKIAFIAFAHNNLSLNVNELETARRVVSEQAQKADVVVVSFHGGAEGSGATRVPYKTEIFFGELRGNLRAFARTVVDAGADLVIGHGPHVLRGMEIYNGRLIAYSLGNFATYGWFQLAGATAETLVLEVNIGPDGRFLNGKINPVRLEGRGIPVLDTTAKSAIFTIRNLSTADFGANAPVIKDDGALTPNPASGEAHR